MIPCPYCQKPLSKVPTSEWPTVELLEPFIVDRVTIWKCEEGHPWLQWPHVTDDDMREAHERAIELGRVGEREREAKKQRESEDQVRILRILGSQEVA